MRQTGYISLILIFAIIAFAWGAAGAATIEPYIDPAYLWDDAGKAAISANENFVVEIRMDNPDNDRTGMSLPLTFYMTGDIDTWNIIHYEGVNGFESTSLWWNLLNMFWTRADNGYPGAWDGVGADTIVWSGGGMNGMPSGSPLETRFEFEFNIKATAGQTAEFCVDSCSVPNVTPPGMFDWLFEDPVPSFGGPYCWPVGCNCTPPQITNCPGADIEQGFDIQFTHDFNADYEIDPNFELISGPGNINPSTGIWTFEASCADIGSHTVTIGLSDGSCPGASTTCQFTITVTNTLPQIDGPCGQTIQAGIDNTTTIDFSATDQNSGDIINWSVENSTSFAGAYSITQDGELNLTPVSGDEGNHGFIIRAADCSGEFSECELTVDVVAVTGFDIVIEHLDEQLQGHHSYVNVTVEEGSEILYGFDFLIGYDPSVLTFVAAMGGPIFDIPGNYEWEYFTYRYSYTGNCGTGCPSGQLRVVGMAEYNDGGHHPNMGVLPSGTVLFTMDFMVTSDYNIGGSLAPIYFYWMDCGDNSIAFNYRSDDPLNILAGLSDKVYMYNGDPYYEITDYNTGFPTSSGAQAKCYINDDPTKPAPVPFVNFYGGGINIISPEDIDDRGDVNLNGVSNEIADAVVFTNYFIYGYSAFSVNLEGQKAATEINGDGIALTVADLVYLIRIVVGDAEPIPKVAPNIFLNVTTDEKSVMIDSEIGAAYFVFEGPVNLALGEDAAGMELAVNMIDGNTVVLLYSFEKGRTASGTVLYTSGKLLSVEAADYNGNSYKTAIIPDVFSSRSYPNPFNPVTTIEMTLPVASEWNIDIYNIAGQRIAAFDGYSRAGKVEVVWDASNFASGIYFYRTRIGEYSSTEKLMLVK